VAFLESAGGGLLVIASGVIALLGCACILGFGVAAMFGWLD